GGVRPPRPVDHPVPGTARRLTAGAGRSLPVDRGAAAPVTAVCHRSAGIDAAGGPPMSSAPFRGLPRYIGKDLTPGSTPWPGTTNPPPPCGPRARAEHRAVDAAGAARPVLRGGERLPQADRARVGPGRLRRDRLRRLVHVL